MKETDLDIARKTWAERAQRFHEKNPSIRAWSESPLVVEMYINPLITGSPTAGWLQGVADRYFQEKVDRALNIGSGDGVLERHGMLFGIAERFDGYDVSPGAVELATSLAAKEGLTDRIQYHAADLNKYEFPPETYDAVFASQSLHHIEALEHVFDQVDRTLKPRGLFVVNEFVGANQFQWPDKQMACAEEQLRKLPKRYRWDPELKKYKSKIVRQTVEMMNSVDPTEAIRSEELLPMIYDRFDVIDRRDFGGTIVNLVLEGIAGNFSSSDEDRAVLGELLRAEQDLLARGELESDFLVLVARQKRGSADESGG